MILVFYTVAELAVELQWFSWTDLDETLKAW